MKTSRRSHHRDATGVILWLLCCTPTVDNELTNVFLKPAMESPPCAALERIIRCSKFFLLFAETERNICFVLSGGMMFNFTLIDLRDGPPLFDSADVKCMPPLCMAAGINTSARPRGRALNHL